MLSELFDGEEYPYDCQTNNSTRPRQMKKPPPFRSSSGFVGLDNQGATCYLNSLLQCLYMTPELRAGLFQIDPTVLGVQYSEKCDDKTDTTKKCDKEPDSALIEQLSSMGFSFPCAYRCLRKVSEEATSEANVLSEALEFALQHAEDPGMNDPLPEMKKKPPKVKTIPLELQRLFSHLHGLQCRSISTQELTERGFQWTGMDGSVQHDAHELNRLLIDALERSLKNTSGDKLCSSLYRGVLSNQVQCLECKVISEREELFYDLLLQAVDTKNVEEALSEFIASINLEGENQYACDICGKRTDGTRRVMIKTVPPVLTLSCQRFDIDRQTWERFKVTTQFRFPVSFSMEPFSRVDEEEKGKDKKSFLWLEDVEAVARRVAKEAVHGLEYFSEEAFREQLADTSSDLHQSLETEFSSYIHGDASFRYELFAVIVHHGTAHSGHYTAYIRDLLLEGEWQDSHRSTSSGDGNGSGSIPPDLCHLVPPSDEEGTAKRVLVLEHSPLHLILTVAESISCTLADLHRDIACNLRDGQSWESKYEETYGSLLSFLSFHSVLFELKQQQGDVAVRLRKGVRYLVTALEAFTQAAFGLSEEELRSFCPSSGRAAALEEAWQQTSSKRDRKKKRRKGSNTHKNYNQEKRADMQSDDESRLVENEKMAIEQSLADMKLEASISNLIMNTFFGPFFRFNDSEVLPVSLLDLKAAYEGTSSAYILVYRNLSLGRHALSNSVLKEQCLSPPSHWTRQVEAMNCDLTASRADYDKFMRSIRLKVLFPCHFTSLWPILSPKTREERSCLPAPVVDGFSLEFDKTKSVRELRTAVFENLKLAVSDDMHDESVLMRSLGYPSSAASLEVKIALLDACSHSTGTESGIPELYAKELLKGDVQVENTICEDSTLFFWWPRGDESRSGRDAPQLEVYPQPPKLFLVTYRCNPHLPSDSSSDVCQKPLWFPVSLPLQQFCSHALEKHFSSSLNGTDMYVRIDLLVEEEMKELSYGKSSSWRASKVFERGRWAKDPSNTAWGQIACGEFVEHELVLDLWPASSKPPCLATNEANRRNRQWSIRVKYEDAAKTGASLRQKLKKLLQNSHSTSCDALQLDEFETSGVVFEVDCDAQLRELKVKVFEQLHPPSQGEAPSFATQLVHLRTGHNVGVGVLLDEERSLKECGLSHNALLRLDFSMAEEGLAGEDCPSIRFSIVTGNDPSSGKLNPHQPGIRSEVQSLRLDDKAETLTQLKQRAVAKHLQSSGDSCKVDEEALKTPRRMRLANWADESTETLLFEHVGSSSGEGAVPGFLPVTVGDAISSGQVRAGDLLLVEEGELPDKDAVTVQVFLWPPSFQLSPAAALPSVLQPSVQSEELEALASAGLSCHPDALSKRDWLVDLGELKCGKYSDISHLYDACFERIAALCEEKEGAMTMPASRDHLLVRELHPRAMLPGRLFRLSSHTGGTTSQGDLAMIGTKTSKRKGGPGALKKTLQKLGFREEGNQIVVQTLDQPQPADSPQPGQVRVWAQMVERCEGEEVCRWPPREVIISGGESPSFGHLTRPLLSAFAIDPVQKMHVFKFEAESWSWVKLAPRMNNQKKRGSSRSENIFASPYSLKDGSFILLDTGHDRSSMDRCEDCFMRLLHKKEKSEKHLKRNRGHEKPTTKSNPQPNTPEIALRIGSAAGDSSDDE